MGSSSKVLDSINLHNVKFPGDARLVTKGPVNISKIEVEGHLNVISGCNTIVESIIKDLLTDKVKNEISSKYLKKAEKSTRFIFKIGNNSNCVTYTPDADGVIRGDNNIVAGLRNLDKPGEEQTPSRLFLFYNNSKGVKDYEMAVSDPDKNITLVSTKKMR